METELRTSYLPTTMMELYGYYNIQSRKQKKQDRQSFLELTALLEQYTPLASTKQQTKENSTLQQSVWILMNPEGTGQERKTREDLPHSASCQIPVHKEYYSWCSTLITSFRH